MSVPSFNKDTARHIAISNQPVSGGNALWDVYEESSHGQLSTSFNLHEHVYEHVVDDLRLNGYDWSLTRQYRHR